MGFLSGSYGKIMAGKLVRTLQNELTSVTSRYNRVTKQVGDLEEMFSRKQNSYNIILNNDMNALRTGLYQKMQNASASGDKSSAMQNYNEYMYSVSELQSQMMFQQSMMAEQLDIIRESQLEPLKAIQDTLETRKDNLESRLQLAKGQYEAKKKEEQDGAKNAVPDYTGSGS